VLDHLQRLLLVINDETRHSVLDNFLRSAVHAASRAALSVAKRATAARGRLRAPCPVGRRLGPAASAKELRRGGLHGHLYSAAPCDSDFRSWFCAEFANRLTIGTSHCWSVRLFLIALIESAPPQSACAQGDPSD
jgi:hypothetical protein